MNSYLQIEIHKDINNRKRLSSTLLDKNLEELENIITNYRQNAFPSTMIFIDQIKDLVKNLEDISIDIYTTNEIERIFMTQNNSIE
ncbi:hypothetical protein K5E_22210 [Enterococcus thailandicus]|uniref:hypothetical protein n=1 Tax=Enterococcus thailandicus TaxID=417368 RepID=UPI00244D8BD8|nr:hypothetical protein [Enterococcus thailandicus]GMC02556.1 hypothetical protein K4E_00660 [Enterococcus thailandicus]GMC10082.1 hypothetical protein K5E_22210 [Enterococcus thailandicus]